MIFKTMTSSIDETRRTIGFLGRDFAQIKKEVSNASGLDKIGRIFTSQFNNAGISKDQMQMIRNWNNAIVKGCVDQETFNRIIETGDKTTKAYFNSLNGGRATLNGLRDATNSATTSTIGLTIASTALNMAITMGLSFAIQGLVKLFDYLIHYHEKQREKLQDLKQEYENISNELQSVQSELETTAQRMDELNEKSNLTFVEQEELDKLRDTNDELQRQRDLLENEKKIAQKDTNKQFVKVMEDEAYDWSEEGINNLAYRNELFKRYERLKDEYSEASTEKDQERIRKQMEKIEKYFLKMAEEWKKDSDGIEYIKNPSNKDEEAVNIWLDYINDFRDRMAIATGGDNAKTNALTRILGKEEFSSVKKQLDDLGRSGELTGEKVKELIPVTSELYQKLLKLGIISDEDTDWFDGLANGLNKVKDEGKDAEKSISKLSSMLSDILGDNGSSKKSNLSTLSAAYKEMAENGVLSLDTVSDLIEKYPELEDKLVTTSKGYAIQKEAIKDLVDGMIEKYELELNKAETAALATAQNLGIETEGYNQVTDAIYEAVKAKLTWLSTPDNAVGMNFDEWSGQYKQYAELLRQMDDVRSRRKNLPAVKGSLYNDLFYESDKKIKENAKKLSDLDKKFNADTIKHKFDVWGQSVEKLNNTMSLLDNTLDLISEDDHIGKIQTTTLQLDLAREKAGLLANEFTELQNTEYDSADAANELASRMKSVDDEIADNQKNILEYGKNIAQYYGDALKAVGTLSKTQIDEATNLLDRNIKALAEGGLAGIQFTLSPVATPQSAIEKQRQENKTLEEEMQAHYNTVANMQKVALDMQYQETMADYARQREELVKSLNEIKTTLGNNSTEVQGIESDKNKKVAEAEKKSNQERLSEEKSFSDQSKGVINDLNNWMKTNLIVAPSLDTTAWDGLVSKAEEYAKKVKDAVNGAQNIPDYPANTKASDIAKAAVTEAKKYEGVPYLWGGTTPNGFDCSGLVQYAMKQAGNDIPRVADDQWHDTKGAKITDMNKLQYGDLVFFGSHDYATHVGMYVGDGQMLHAPHTGDVVKYTDIFNSDYYKSRFLGARRYYGGTGTFDYDGVAGETYEPEYLIDKKTGKATRVTSPTPVNTKTTDVVGVKQTKELEKHKYAGGTIKVPNGLGKYYTYMAWDAITNMDTEQGRLIKAYGRNYDSQGYGKIGDRYALAMTSTFGKIGDVVDIQLNDGSVIHGVIADEKSQTYTSWDHNPANQWGHDNGQSMVEFVTNWKGGHSNPFGGIGSGVAEVRNLGSAFDTSDFSMFSPLLNNVSTIAENTTTIVRPDFMSQLADIINSTSASSKEKKETTEDALLAFIADKMPEAEASTERFISAFDELQSLQDGMQDTLAEYSEQLKAAAGSSNFVNLRTQITNFTDDYLLNLQRATAKLTAEQAKDAYDRAKQARDLSLEYYNTRKASGEATADELFSLANSISEQDENLRTLSDNYVSVLSSYRDYVIGLAEREAQRYEERITWQDKINDELERELDYATSSADRAEAMGKLMDSLETEIDMLNEQKDAAHKAVLDLYNNADYAEVFKEFDMESWFDANAEFSAQYMSDLARKGAENPEIVPIMKEIAGIIQVEKKTWLSADEKLDSIYDRMDDVRKEIANDKVETYTKIQERLNAIDEVRASKQDKRTAAMESRNSFNQTIRQELADIKAEVDANMHTSQWLDEDTRKLLFNSEDYAKQRRELEDLQGEADSLYNRYVKDLNKLDETEYFKEAEITAEYERQMDILNDKLNVSKQQLALTKKELEYQNALKERDTRIIIGGRSVMVANPDTMYNLAKERSQAESELRNTEITYAENEDVRDSRRISDSINQEIAAREKLIDILGKMSDAELTDFSDYLPIQDMLDVYLANLSDVNIPWISEHMKDYQNAYRKLPDIYKFNGYNLTHDYAADEDDILAWQAAGIISNQVAKDLLRSAQMQHGRKAATAQDYHKYLGTLPSDKNFTKKYYGIDDEAQVSSDVADKTAQAISENFAAEMEKVAAEIVNGMPTAEQAARLRELETLRNRKIFLEGLDYEQTSNWGGIKFEDFQRDYSEAMDYVKDMAMDGLEKSDMNKMRDQLARWEQLKAEKVAAQHETSMETREDVATVVQEMDGDGIPVSAPKLEEIGQDVLTKLGENLSATKEVSSSSKKSSEKIAENVAATKNQTSGGIARGNYSGATVTFASGKSPMKFASGTKSAPEGLAITDENKKYEYKMRPIANGKYTPLEQGDMVIPHDVTENMLAWGEINPADVFKDNIKRMTQSNLMNLQTVHNDNSTVVTQHFTGDFNFTETIQNGDEFIQSLMQETQSYYDVNKNRKH